MLAYRDLDLRQGVHISHEVMAVTNNPKHLCKQSPRLMVLTGTPVASGHVVKDSLLTAPVC
jgi:hypothetical protein